MTGRQRIERAFSGQGTDWPAAVICYEGIYLRDRWDELSPLPWWSRYSPDIEARSQAVAAAVQAIGQDWFRIDACEPRQDREQHRIRKSGTEVILENPVTGETRKLERPAVGGWIAGGTTPESKPADTQDAVDRLIPDVPAWDAARFETEGRADYARAMIKALGRERVALTHVASPLWGCYYLWGFEGWMTRLAEAPDLVAYAANRLLQNTLRQVNVAAACGAELVWIEECMTDLIPPRQFETLNRPLLAALTAAIRQAGMRSIYYYCGNPESRLNILTQCGADALALEEGKKGFEIDIAKVSESVKGSCVLLGNLDAVRILQNGTDDELKAELKRQWKAGQANGGRFIMSVGSPVTPETPPERVRRYTGIVTEMDF